MGRFLLAKGILKSLRNALIAGGTAGITTLSTGNLDKLESAIITIATFLISLFIDWLKHRK